MREKDVRVQGEVRGGRTQPEGARVAAAPGQAAPCALASGRSAALGLVR